MRFTNKIFVTVCFSLCIAALFHFRFQDDFGTEIVAANPTAEQPPAAGSDSDFFSHFRFLIRESYKATKTDPEIGLEKAGTAAGYLLENDGRILESGHTFKAGHSSLTLYILLEKIRAYDQLHECEKVRDTVKSFKSIADTDLLVIDPYSEQVYSPEDDRNTYEAMLFDNINSIREKFRDPRYCDSTFGIDVWYSPQMNDSNVFFNAFMTRFYSAIHCYDPSEPYDYEPGTEYYDIVEPRNFSSRIRAMNDVLDFLSSIEGHTMSDGSSFTDKTIFHMSAYVALMNIYDWHGNCEEARKYYEMASNMKNSCIQFSDFDVKSTCNADNRHSTRSTDENSSLSNIMRSFCIPIGECFTESEYLQLIN